MMILKRTLLDVRVKVLHIDADGMATIKGLDGNLRGIISKAHKSQLMPLDTKADIIEYNNDFVKRASAYMAECKVPFITYNPEPLKMRSKKDDLIQALNTNIVKAYNAIFFKQL